eukprot:1788647-Prymnesium_polylepis.1
MACDKNNRRGVIRSEMLYARKCYPNYRYLLQGPGAIGDLAKATVATYQRGPTAATICPFIPCPCLNARINRFQRPDGATTAALLAPATGTAGS